MKIAFSFSLQHRCFFFSTGMFLCSNMDVYSLFGVAVGGVHLYLRVTDNIDIKYESWHQVHNYLFHNETSNVDITCASEKLAANLTVLIEISRDLKIELSRSRFTIFGIWYLPVYTKLFLTACSSASAGPRDPYRYLQQSTCK